VEDELDGDSLDLESDLAVHHVAEVNPVESADGSRLHGPGRRQPHSNRWSASSADHRGDASPRSAVVGTAPLSRARAAGHDVWIEDRETLIPGQRK